MGAALRQLHYKDRANVSGSGRTPQNVALYS